jgi:hypothetical protein
MRRAPSSRGFGHLGPARECPTPAGTGRSWAGAGNAPRSWRPTLVALGSRTEQGTAEAKGLRSLRSLPTLRSLGSLRSHGPGVPPDRTGIAAGPLFCFFCLFCAVPPATGTLMALMALLAHGKGVAKKRTGIAGNPYGAYGAGVPEVAVIRTTARSWLAVPSRRVGDPQKPGIM